MQGVTRSILWVSFFGIILAAWWMMYSMSIGMGLDLLGRPGAMPMDMKMDMSAPATDDGMAMPSDNTAMTNDGMAMSSGDAMSEDTMTMPADGTTNTMSMDGTMKSDDMPMGSGMDMDAMGMAMMTRFGPLFGMWAAMMAAMMLPTMVPTLRAYEDLMRSADGTRVGWVGVLTGYFVVWVLFAALITAVQLALLHSGLINMMGVAQYTWLTAGLLIVVGAFQFTRAKEICHGVCHSPMGYYLGHWHTGFAGGARMGVGLGAFCVGCCWGFMALGFVGGVMSLAWMGLATVFMILEKLPQIGHVVTKPAGAVLILAGVGVAVWPYLGG